MYSNINIAKNIVYSTTMSLDAYLKSQYTINLEVSGSNYNLVIFVAPARMPQVNFVPVIGSLTWSHLGDSGSNEKQVLTT